MLISFAVGDELTSRITRNSAVPVKGRVTDITGGGIVGATVRITNTQSDVAWEAITDSAGTYAFPNLEPGTYKVEVTANGFRKYEQQPVKVAAGFNLALPLKPAP
jgi:protocatechuate 3,4-dioxygenase beta subunit